MYSYECMCVLQGPIGPQRTSLTHGTALARGHPKFLNGQCLRHGYISSFFPGSITRGQCWYRISVQHWPTTFVSKYFVPYQ